MKKTKILTICIMAVVLVVAACPIVSFGANTTVEFEDEELATKVESALKGEVVSREGNTLTIADIDNITQLSLNGNNMLSTCKSLKGLDKFTNLEALRIAGGKFSDLTPISKLSKLTSIEITSSKVDNIKPITNLKNLKILYLENNNLHSIEGIEKLTELTALKIGNGNYTTDDSVIAKNEINKISDISGIEKLSKLNYFDAKNMMIYQKVKVGSKETKVTVDLPQLVVSAKTQNSIIYTAADLDIQSGTLSEDGTKITMQVKDLKEGKVKVKIVGNQSGSSADGTIVNFEYIEAFEVVDVKKDPDTENADKVKVTITVNKELDKDKLPAGWTLGEDGKSISKEFDKNGKEDVTLIDKDGNTIKQTVEVSNIKDGSGDKKEEFKVINKTEEDKGNGKVKVTITVNKELDPNKLPDGWTLTEDGKSIWKVMDKGTSEDLTLVAKDGSTIKYTVTAGDKTTAPGKIPQTGVKNTIIFVVAGIAIVGTVVFIRSRKMLK